MGVLDKLLFWKTDDQAADGTVIEAVDGYTVDGCFTLPEEQQAADIYQDADQDMDQMRADIKADIEGDADGVKPEEAPKDPC